MSDQSFGSRLRAAREARGMTQAEAAARAGTTQGRWGAWERDELHPTPRVADRIAAALDVPLLDLAPEFADLAFPGGVILLRQVAKGEGRYRLASAEHAARAEAIGWPDPTIEAEIGLDRLADLLSLAHARGRVVAFDPAR